MNEVSEAIVTIRQLQAENARLKRQLDRVLPVLRRHCPGRVDLPELPCKGAKCADCWQQALNSIK